jgi:hypothetical protein
MAFCGQCGTLLSPRDVNCPRCGAVTEPDLGAEDVQTDAPTIASSLSNYPSGVQALQADPQRPASPPSAPGQQKLVLPGNASPANESAGIMEAESYAPPTPPGFLPPSNMQAAQPAKRRRNAVMVAFITTLLILLVVAGSVTAIVLRQSGFFGNNNPPPPLLTPAQRARALLQRYYYDINNRYYHDAYNLWWDDPQNPRPTYDRFVRGYANTQHDDITFDAITPNADGTVRVDLTIAATETTTTGTTISTYQGSYIVGQRNGSWKIVRGNFQKIG